MDTFVLTAQIELDDHLAAFVTYSKLITALKLYQQPADLRKGLGKPKAKAKASTLPQSGDPADNLRLCLDDYHRMKCELPPVFANADTMLKVTFYIQSLRAYRQAYSVVGCSFWWVGGLVGWWW